MQIYDMRGVSAIVNLTPHAIVLALEEDNPLTIPPEGEPARVAETLEDLHFLQGGLRIVTATYGSVYWLPPARKGVLLIVSRMVLAACPSRRDLVAPGTAIRDAQGRIIGCENLIANGSLDLLE